MRILFLNYESPPLGGGAGNATEYLLREYAKMPDLTVDLVTSSHDSEERVIQVAPNVTVYALPIGKDAQALHYQSMRDLLTYSFKGYAFAKGLMQENRYDAIHAFFTVPCGVMAWRLGKRFKVPYIVSLRGADVPGYSERFSLLYAFIRPLVRRVWRDAARVVSNSQGLKELALQTNPAQEIGVIPNGVATDEFKPSEKGMKDAVRVICVSRLTPRKGIRYLVEAMRILKDEKGIADAKLTIVGEGDEEAELKSLAARLGIQDAVLFRGRVAHDRLPQEYNAADIFCLPSLNEGMSNTLLEALASGLPIVATVTGGTHELVQDGVNGFFVEMQSAEDIAEKLARLMTDPELRQRFGAESRKRAEAMSWRVVAERYSEVYGQAKY